jgi:hypothetical protein
MVINGKYFGKFDVRVRSVLAWQVEISYPDLEPSESGAFQKRNCKIFVYVTGQKVLPLGVVDFLRKFKAEHLRRINDH